MSSQPHADVTGVRQSRRLAALTEAGSDPQPETHTMTTIQSRQQSASAAQSSTYQAPATAAAAEAAATTAGIIHASRQESQDQATSAQLQPPSLLQASTLEASANVLKGLVRLCLRDCVHCWISCFILFLPCICSL